MPLNNYDDLYMFFLMLSFVYVEKNPHCWISNLVLNGATCILATTNKVSWNKLVTRRYTYFLKKHKAYVKLIAFFFKHNLFSGNTKVTTVPASPLVEGGAFNMISASHKHRKKNLFTWSREETPFTMERNILYWILLLELLHACCGQSKYIFKDLYVYYLFFNFFDKTQ